MSVKENVIRMMSEAAEAPAAEPANADPSAAPDGDGAATGVPGGGEALEGTGADPRAEAEGAGAAPDPKAARNARLRENIREIRERREAGALVREAQRLMQEARAAKEAAEAEVAERREKLKGGWKDGLKALGYDPLAVFDEMTQEALKAGTPEAQVAAMKEQLASMVTPLQQEIERLREREQQVEAARYEADFRSAVVQASSAPEYEALSIYEPVELVEAARLVGDRLTAAGERVTVGEILDVLALQQRQYEERVLQKRGRPPQARTVNGTVARQTDSIGNSTVSQTLPRQDEESYSDPVARRKANVARLLARETKG